jgi:hypothetical protein
MSWLAAIAQLVEHVIRNDGVGGSSPSCGTSDYSEFSPLCRDCRCFLSRSIPRNAAIAFARMLSLEVLSIGHSTLAYDRFLALLRQAGVTAIADVRSVPYSRRNPQFNRETLKDALLRDGIAYVSLGEQVGGRPKGEAFFCDGGANYEKMAETPAFAEGLKRLVAGANKYRIAMMCAEHDPLDCHRCLLVGRALHGKDVSVKHILSDGMIVSHQDVETRLLEMSDKNSDDLFETSEGLLAIAYRQRSRSAAYSKRTPTSEGAPEQDQSES